MASGTEDALHEAIALDEVSLDELFEAASRELAAMPVEQARTEVAQLVALAERVTTVDALVATTRERTATVEILVAAAEVGRQSGEVTATVTEGTPAVPNLARLKKWLIFAGTAAAAGALKEVGKEVFLALKAKVLALAAAYHIASGQPAHMDSAEQPPPPAIEMHAPAPAQAPPLGHFAVMDKT